MRVFISEFVCGGGWPGEVPESLASEGEAMLRAVVADFSRLDGVQVTTTWDDRLGPACIERAQVISIDRPDTELPVFRELAGLCDATLIIAPEIDGILTMRASIALQAGARLLGPSLEAIALCSDKLRLARHWQDHGIPTIPTFEVAAQEPVEFPTVIKPRDGAGSQGVRLIASRAEWDTLKLDDREKRNLLWQPYVSGRAVSCALFANPDWPDPIVLPPAEQLLSRDGRFVYQGGRIPAPDVDLDAIQTAAAHACSVISGLRGYVGIDLIVPQADCVPVAVEINPRLTTSYVGYRQMAFNNLASHFFIEATPDWLPGTIQFRTSGFPA